jgi:hypothetical protein
MRGDQPELGIGRTEGARRQAVPGNALKTRAEKGGPRTRSDRSRATEGGWIRRSLDGSKCLHGLDRRHKLIPVSPGPDGCSPWPVALRSHTHTHTHYSTANRRAPMFILLSTRPAVWKVAFTSPGPPDPLGLATHSPALLSAAANPGRWRSSRLALPHTPAASRASVHSSVPQSRQHSQTALRLATAVAQRHRGTVAPRPLQRFVRAVLAIRSLIVNTPQPSQKQVPSAPRAGIHPRPVRFLQANDRATRPAPPRPLPDPAVYTHFTCLAKSPSIALLPPKPPLLIYRTPLLTTHSHHWVSPPTDAVLHSAHIPM